MLTIIGSGSAGSRRAKSGRNSMKSLLYALPCRECRGYQSHAQVRAERNLLRHTSMGVTNQALPSGYQLLNYRVDRQISRGGFSNVYRAFDDGGGPGPVKGILPPVPVL